jgi:hypothetical protein
MIDKIQDFIPHGLTPQQQDPQRQLMTESKGLPNHFLKGTSIFLKSHRLLQAWYKLNIPAPNSCLGWFTWGRQMVFEPVAKTKNLKNFPAVCHFFCIKNDELVEFRSEEQQDSTILVRIYFWKYDVNARALNLRRILRKS